LITRSAVDILEVTRESVDRRFGSLGHCRLEALDLAQHGRGMKQDIAAVPEVTIGHIVRGGHGVRLLHERLHREH
jgi:hypothetical protein